MLKALRFEILRDVQASGRIRIPLAEAPVRVATLLDEAAFNEDHLLIHHKTVFFEDKTHDWDHRNGGFYYYTRIAERADVLVVYELDANYTQPEKFDVLTGQPLAGSSAKP